MTIHDLAEYEILDEHRVEDVQSDGFILRHKKSGARIAILSNNDDNKVFYIGFRTPPEDETGVPHIIEHTTLCGSKKFPVKDPFIELAKGSLNTFLNAMTYPDKTVYPIASCNDQDFKNLMDVYLDAVFNPNITKYEEIFKQEGWHYELTGKDDELKINGVVYNEMKGAYSSPDEVLSSQIYRSLFPDNTYSKDSGGNPEYIPKLTYESYTKRSNAGSGLPAIIAATTSSLRPRLRIVSIIPGIEALAPERTDTRRGFLRSPNFFPLTSSIHFTPSIV